MEKGRNASCFIIILTRSSSATTPSSLMIFSLSNEYSILASVMNCLKSTCPLLVDVVKALMETVGSTPTELVGAFDQVPCHITLKDLKARKTRQTECRGERLSHRIAGNFHTQNISYCGQWRHLVQYKNSYMNKFQTYQRYA